MKNQIIKKIMAYLLVGAMVITTPMTASANELENAYATGTETEGVDTSTNTDTDTNTNTQGVEPVEPGVIPDEVLEYFPQILDITLDPESLAFDKAGQTKPIQARVVFDDYNPAGEEMQWAAITADQKAEIEKNIHWFSDDPSVVSFADNQVNDTNTGSKAIVESIGGGQTRIYAWIEKDGVAYIDENGNAVDRPTPGDICAVADVSVKNTIENISFNTSDPDLGYTAFTKFAKGKRQYDLRKYTIIEYTDGTKELASESNVNLTYSISNTASLKSEKVTASLTDAGLLKITKGDAGKVIELSIVDENGYYADGQITLVTPNPITKIEKFNPNKTTLDMGISEKRSMDLTCPATTPSIADTTDELVWSSNKPAIVSVTSQDDGAKATITAEGVGTAKVTVKASSGKSAVLTVTVYATPSKVEIKGDPSGYSGKPMKLEAVLTGDNGQILPVGNTTFKWSIAKVANKKDPNAKVSAKKAVATVTPANLLSDLENEVTTTVNLTATFKNPAKSTKNAEDFEIKLTQSDVKNVSIAMFQQAQPYLIATMPATNAKSKETYALSYTNKLSEKFYVEQEYLMEASSTDESSQAQIDSIAWAVTGKNVVSNASGATLTTKFTGSTKTTIKASYITVDRSKSKPKAVKNTKTINITPVQNATSIAFAKPVVVKNPAKNTAKAQTVTFTIKNIVPKKANYGTITWKVLAYDASTGTQYTTDSAKEGLTQKTDLIKTSKASSVTINVPGTFTAGSIIKVGAYSQVGVVAYGYVYVTEQTTKVIPQASKNGAAAIEAGTKKTNMPSMKLGTDDTLKLSAKLATKYYEGGKIVTPTENRDAAMGAVKLGDDTYSTTTAYQTEPVTYTLDKKSATIIKVDADGKVTPLKRGTATVTIKTLSNKSAKVKIVVE